MATRTKLPTEGVTVPEPCPICGARLTWHGRTWRLTCSGCGLAGGLTLGPDEARDLAWHLALPGLQGTPLTLFLVTLLAVHHLAAAEVEADPKAVYTREHKWRVLPAGAETYQDRAARLSTQAELNGVDVAPVQWDTDREELIPWDGTGVPVLFRVSSQRRNADGTRLRWYAPVEVSSHRADCPCEASGLCAHIRAAADWLTAWNEAEREREAEVAWNSEAGPSLQEAVAELCG